MMKESLEKAGFVDIKIKGYKCPIGTWAKERRLKRVGKMSLATMETGLEGYAMAALTRVLSLDKYEAEGIIKAAWDAAKSNETHLCWM